MNCEGTDAAIESGRSKPTKPNQTKPTNLMKPQSNHHRTALVSGASIHTPKKTTMSRCLCHFAACLALVPVSALEVQLISGPKFG
jgi:hypothetical protein